jgi:uncharacterized protein
LKKGPAVVSGQRQTALITGASSGIGFEFAKLFAADGHTLVLVARRAEKLAALAAELREKHGPIVHVWREDLADPTAPKRVADRADAEGIEVDVLVNNAGFGAWGAFAELPVEAQLRMMYVNMTALTELTHRFLPGMRQRRRGRILNVSSVVAFQPGPYLAVYSASKAFVLSFSEALAAELTDSGVSVTCLCPGFTATEFQAVAGLEQSRVMDKMKPMSAEAVAAVGYRGLMQGRRLAVPGFINWIGAIGVRFLPRRTAVEIVRRIQAPL